jgi:putative PIN family toxin of toxin-antitoxin system
LTRVVFDASVLLSAAVASPDSPVARLVDAVESRAFEAIVSPLVLAEFRNGLAKPYFNERVGAQRASEIVAAFEAVALVVPDPSAPPRVLRDPSDDFLVALAREVGADVIVTGDRDLLDHEGLVPPAITPRAACEMLGVAL